MRQPAQQILDRFISRDKAAVEDLNAVLGRYPSNPDPIVQFLNGRVEDLCTIVAQLLRREIEREKLESISQTILPKNNT